jgi:hypothetical protein
MSDLKEINCNAENCGYDEGNHPTDYGRPRPNKSAASGTNPFWAEDPVGFDNTVGAPPLRMTVGTAIVREH